MRNTDWAALDRPLTDDERAWLTTREQFDVIEANDRKFDAMDEEDGDGAGEDDSQEAGPDYDAMTSKELKAEVKARQDAGREIDITGMTKKSQVAGALRADDAAAAAEADTE